MSFDHDDDDMLGYGRPPKWTRFRPGKSGNPNGRPKKQGVPTRTVPTDCEADAVLRHELNRPVKAKEGKKEVKLSMRALIQRSQATSAAKGNVRAQRDVLQAARELDLHDAALREHQLEISRRVFANMVAWKEERRKVWAAVRKKGQEPKDPWPHPDDILLDEAKQDYRIRGPNDSEGVPLYEYMRAQRDLHFTYAALAWRGKKANKIGWFRFHCFVWKSYDQMLPLRWQLDDHGAAELTGYLMLIPIGDLRKSQSTYIANVERWSHAGPSEKYSKEAYAFTNQVMKPLLQHHGYRSLAEFDAAIEDSDGDPPWPKLPALKKIGKG